MTALQLAGGIILGFGGLEIIKALVATAYETRKRHALKKDLVEVADTFIDKMHKDLMAEREAEAAKAKKNANRRRPATTKKPSANVAQPRKPITRKKAGK